MRLRNLLFCSLFFVTLITGCTGQLLRKHLTDGERVHTIIELGTNVDKLTNKYTLIFYESGNYDESTIMVSHAFLLYRAGLHFVRHDLIDGKYNEDLGKYLCTSDKSNFYSVRGQKAIISKLSSRSIPYLIIYGRSGGSAGYSDIDVYPLHEDVLERSEGTICEEQELLDECSTWADNQTSKVRADRWNRAESIDDILYVMKSVVGE